jgi:glycosyltransferase involved in cell wall biosynthesis
MFGDSFWRRYLTAFDSVNVICRIRPATADDKPIPIVDDRVRFLPVPFYEGPREFLKLHRSIRKQLHDRLDAAEAVILRVPQILPTFAGSTLCRRGYPFGVEVVGDPWDVYAPGAEANRLRPLFRRYFRRKLRTICSRAAASCYVTEFALQKRYPPKPGTFTTFASSVQLDQIVSAPRPDSAFSTNPCRLLFVGALNRLYKGQDILIRAVGELVAEGFDLTLRIVGDGQYRGQLEALAREVGLGTRVVFTGALPFGERIFAEMDQADLFVLPSRQEGLARTVPEAMSRGLPCISSDVGGMSEVVPAECLVPPGDLQALKSRLRQLATSAETLAALSERAVCTASRFLVSEIEPRREQFMMKLCRETERVLGK